MVLGAQNIICDDFGSLVPIFLKKPGGRSSVRFTELRPLTIFLEILTKYDKYDRISPSFQVLKKNLHGKVDFSMYLTAKYCIHKVQIRG